MERTGWILKAIMDDNLTTARILRRDVETHNSLLHKVFVQYIWMSEEKEKETSRQSWLRSM
jgi:hypothetical protein